MTSPISACWWKPSCATRVSRRAYRARRPNLVILDVWLQGSKLDGIGILEAMHQEEPSVPVVMISGHGTIETAVAAIQRGAYDFIEKPFNSDRLLLVVRRALEAAKLAADNAELRLRVGPETTLTGDGHSIATLRAAIERVAPTGSRVLIAGPPGSGKETVARMIHTKSRRGEGPFVSLNCAILAPEKFETELFGVEAGPDAPRRVGVLERAHGGTLLLDEISEMPIETQGKIARVLQDQSFERVGGGSASRVKVDIRVIATTVLPSRRGAVARARTQGTPRGHPCLGRRFSGPRRGILRPARPLPRLGRHRGAAGA
jgi:two-component system nitrogen regulation response regulator NtrX